MNDTAIQTSAFGKVYPGGVRALEEMSLRTSYGEVFAYLGAQRLGQDHHHPHPHHPDRRHQRKRRGGRP